MRTIFTVCAILLLVSGSDAQETESRKPKLALRTSLLSFMETDANVVMGVGVHWKSRWAVIAEGGYVFEQPFENFSNVDYGRNRVSGIKLRTEVRYYLKDLVYTGRTTYYLAPVFHYKKVYTDRWEQFGINCANGECDYFQIATYTRVKQETGGMVTFGSYSPLFRSKRFGIETYVGLGVKVKKFRDRDFPPGSMLLNAGGRSWFMNDEDGTYAMFPVGLKLSFQFL